MVRKSIKKDELICQENNPGNEMYFIEKGKVKVFKTINSEKVELSILKENDFFGEMCLFLNSIRYASIIALENTKLIVLDKDALLNQIKEKPSFAYKIIRVMAKRLEAANGIITRLEGEKKSLKIMYGNL